MTFYGPPKKVRRGELDIGGRRESVHASLVRSCGGTFRRLGLGPLLAGSIGRASSDEIVDHVRLAARVGRDRWLGRFRLFPHALRRVKAGIKKSVVAHAVVVVVCLSFGFLGQMEL